MWIILQFGVNLTFDCYIRHSYMGYKCNTLKTEMFLLVVNYIFSWAHALHLKQHILLSDKTVTQLSSTRDISLSNNTHQLDTIHNHFHFIKTQSLNMFQASDARNMSRLWVLMKWKWLWIVSSWCVLLNYTVIHGQQNIKCFIVLSVDFEHLLLFH
jgi:hypothetical protein